MCTQQYRGIHRLLIGLALIALLVFGQAPVTRAQSGEVVVTLFHDTHLHGSLQGSDDVTFAHFVGLMDQVRRSLPAPGYSLFVGNGDDIAPSVMTALFGGEQMVDSYNAAQLTATTFGNHEFDLGPDDLRDLIGKARYGYVSANVRDAATGDVFGKEAGARPWTIQTVGGVRFGLTGLAPTETPEVSSPGAGVAFVDPVVAMQEIVPLMRADGAQVIVLLSHLCGDETERVAALVDGIDVAVGDHCAGVLAQPKVVNGTIISRRGDGLGLLGQLDLTIRDGRVVRHAYQQHRVTASAPVDPAVAAVVDDYVARMAALLDVPVGTITEPLDTTRAAVRTGEAAVGNLIADALRSWARADVAIQNGGAIRGDRIFEPGLLLKRDVVTILPFPNTVAVLRVTGATLVAALENGISQVESLERPGRFPQVSGVRFLYDPALPAGGRVLAAWVGDQPLDPDGSYTLVVNDFLAGGGDGYTMLRDAEVILPGSSGPLVTNVVMEHLAAVGSAAPQVEGRIRTGTADDVSVPEHRSRDAVHLLTSRVAMVAALRR